MPGPTRFDGGVETTHIVSAETVKNTGRVFWVGNSTTVAPNGIAGADVSAAGYGQSPLKPFATLDFAIGRCTADRGDTIFIMPNHAETIAAAAGIALDVAGVTVIGLGVGENRPRFTFSATGSTFTMGANDTKLLNIIGLPSVDSVTNAFVVTGNDCELGLEWIETDDAIEAITVVRLDTADNAVLNLRVLGRTGGNAMARCVAVDDTDNARINIDGYGIVTTAWVNLVDAASTNIRVDGRLFTQGITTGARDVVDTVGGSTWSGEVFDASAGGKFSGGSAAAWASDDITIVATAVGAVADAALADTIEGAAAATQSLVTDLKGVLQRLGADNGNNTAATTLVAANADGSVLERLETIQAAAIVIDEFHDVPAADNVLNAQINEVIGNKTDAAIADTIEGAAATTQTLVADLKAVLQRIGADSANNTAATTLVAANADGSVLERQEFIQTGLLALPRSVEKTDGAVLLGDDALFTITGGPVKILEITGIVTTDIGAGATNVRLQLDTTTPAATVELNAGAVDINADAAGTSYQSINTTGVFTPVTAGFVLEANSFATLPTTYLAPIGSIVLNSDAARTGVIAWYLRYVPLSPNSRVVAAA